MSSSEEPIAPNADDTSYFEKHEFIAPMVMQFLGIRSLIRFSATNTGFRVLKDTEVARCKARFRQCEQEVNELLSPTAPPRANVLKAVALYEEAENLIDAEGTRRRLDRKVFGEERQRMKSSEDAYEHPPFFILPLCFYVPPMGEAHHIPSEKAIAAMDKRALWLWHAEDHMQFFYEMEGFEPYYRNRKYPFRKFHRSMLCCFITSFHHSFLRLSSHYILLLFLKKASLKQTPPGSSENACGM